jgi:uncharacterized membrane protein
MMTVMSGKQARSTWLTAAAGLLLLGTAVVMMVCAAPRLHAAGHSSTHGEQLVSWAWVTRGHPVSGPVAHILNEVRP